PYNESQFGASQRMDQATGQSRSIRYNPPQGGEALRGNCLAPIRLPPHANEHVYQRANMPLRSTDRGDTPTENSPDHTQHTPERRGGTGNIQDATITTVDASPITAGVIWADSDDGNVQVAREGGQNWTNVTDRITGHPGYWVSRVVASHHDAATAYVSV